jgi:hypothetical protein
VADTSAGRGAAPAVQPGGKPAQRLPHVVAEVQSGTSDSACHWCTTGGAMTQEGRIRRRFRQGRVATVELVIMVLLAGTLLGPCVRSTPESGSAARPGSTPEPDSGPTKAPTREPDSEPTPEPDSGSTPEPTSEPTPSPPDPGRERVDEGIGLLESGVVSYRPPRSMRQGESEDLVVLVQRDSTQRRSGRRSRRGSGGGDAARRWHFYGCEAGWRELRDSASRRRPPSAGRRPSC